MYMKKQKWDPALFDMFGLPYKATAREIIEIEYYYYYRRVHVTIQDSESTPPRITSNVKQNLRFLKLWKVAALKEDGCPKVWVVTSDHCHQQAAHGAGAFIWSCKALVTEIKASQKEVERMLQEQRSTSFQGRLLKHNLDAEVVDALKDLRQKLSENELK
ncbi:uncharacterized protein LOC114393442 [Glycine soja]|uniref:uncharacterized protein LOC114393442 n=1 Tax=Glycine soja TaxID=3848 RepID=UPI0010394184|nr:uncharacterized protein LOC114393442 [Glycine soja]